MQSTTLLQLGDIHLPDSKDELLGDVQDQAASAALVASIAPRKLQLVVRKAQEICHRSDTSGILICGDLTSRGSFDGYSECVQYLASALNLTGLPKWTPNTLHAVPGNHDVDRANCDPAEADLIVKFKPLSVPWSTLGLPILAVDVVRSTSVSVGGSTIGIHSINSCMGCGEKRHLPQKVADKLKTLLDDYAASAAPSDAFSVIGEQLDTPAFQHEQIETLMHSIGAMDDRSVPLVLAHHNVLPQAIPRVDLYTDVMNGGLVRSRLTACSRPIVYCHGHIHDDAIEVVLDPRRPRGKLIVVSAPELIKGFNTLTFYFARNALPLGCEIVCYRLRNDGAVVPATPVRVSLIPRDSIAMYRDDVLQSVLESLTASPVRFEILRNQLNSTRESAYQRNTIRDSLIEGEWLDLVEIVNREHQTQHWQIRRREDLTIFASEFDLLLEHIKTSNDDHESFCS